MSPGAADGERLACPYCASTYPMVSALLGQTVRCKVCRGIFRVGEGFDVDGVRPPSGSTPAAPEVGPHAPARGRRKVGYASESAGVAAKKPDYMSGSTRAVGHEVGSARGGAVAERERKRKERTEKLARASVRMKDLARQASQRIAREEERRASVSTSKRVRTVPVGGGSSSATSPSTSARRATGDSAAADLAGIRSVVTGEGERLARSRRWWLVAAGGLAVVIGLIVWLQIDSPQRLALRAFDERLTSGSVGLEFGGALEGPFGGGEIAPIQGVGEARIGPVRRVALNAVERLAREWEIAVRGVWWCKRGQAKAVSRAWLLTEERGEAARAAFRAQLARQGLVLRSHREIRELIVNRATHGEILADLLSAPPPAKGPDIALMFANGILPDALEVCSFGGTDGLFRYKFGEHRRVYYRGLLLRFVGDHPWPQGWRVARLKAQGGLG